MEKGAMKAVNEAKRKLAGLDSPLDSNIKHKVRRPFGLVLWAYLFTCGLLVILGGVILMVIAYCGH